MNAGRELDALVAEKVMGWKDPSPVFGLMEDVEGNANFPPDYSTSIAAAWRVVEKWQGDITVDRRNEHFKVTFYKPSYEYEVWAETLPLAICLAALKAVGHPMEESR